MAEEKRYATEMYNKADGHTYTVRDAEAHEAIASLNAGLEQKADAGTVYTKSQTDSKLSGYVPLSVYNQLLSRVTALETALNRIISGGGIVIPPDDGPQINLVDSDGNSIIASFVDENDNVYQITFEEVTSQSN